MSKRVIAAFDCLTYNPIHPSFTESNRTNATWGNTKLVTADNALSRIVRFKPSSNFL